MFTGLIRSITRVLSSCLNPLYSYNYDITIQKKTDPSILLMPLLPTKWCIYWAYPLSCSPLFRPPILTNIFLSSPNQAHTSHELKLASATLRTRRERWRRPWGQRALDCREMVLGNGHPKTLTTANNIAVVFQKKGEHDKALERYQRALDVREKAFSKDHPNALTTVNSIAGVFYQAGEYDKDLEWYQRALHGREKSLERATRIPFTRQNTWLN